VDQVKGIGTPENILAVGMLTRGYSAKSPAARPRKKAELKGDVTPPLLSTQAVALDFFLTD
jgi:hypothetical protein